MDTILGENYGSDPNTRGMGQYDCIFLKMMEEMRLSWRRPKKAAAAAPADLRFGIIEAAPPPDTFW